VSRWFYRVLLLSKNCVFRMSGVSKVMDKVNNIQRILLIIPFEIESLWIRVTVDVEISSAARCIRLLLVVNDNVRCLHVALTV